MSAPLRVAAYCRVSTDQSDQLNSLQNQKQYFEQYIGQRPGWTLTGIYADEGITGTSTRRRAQFNAMIAAAERGEIDLILTKEVSRFARNTVDALAYTRRLKALGVGVKFLSDNIDTRENDGEFRLTIMASVAQEESRKTSERVKWGQRRSMERGVVFGADNLYGFRVSGGTLTVKQHEAEIVRLIYAKFLEEGKGTHVIARELTEAGVPAPSGAGRPWSSTMTLRVLRNEKYCGDLLQRKTCTPDYLSHRTVRNTGQEEQVYLRGHHEAIVSRETFERAQAELSRRASQRTHSTRHSGRYWCSGKVLCGACGGRMTLRTSKRVDGSVYRLWTCRNCGARSVGERVLKACMEHLLAALSVDMPQQAGQVLHAWRALASPGDGKAAVTAEIERVRRKKARAMDAFLAGTISEQEFAEVRRRYDGELAAFERRLKEMQQPAACPDEAALIERLCRSEAVLGELLGQVKAEEGRLVFRLNSLPAGFYFTYHTTGRGVSYRTCIDSFWIQSQEKGQP